jgi:hypothetical protein
LEAKSSSSGVEDQDYGREDPLRWPRDALYLQKLELTSLRSGGRSQTISNCDIKDLIVFLNCKQASLMHFYS